MSLDGRSSIELCYKEKNGRQFCAHHNYVQDTIQLIYNLLAS